ncbi:MAG: 5/3-nucleotidase [Synergistaceae bacterium]|nr:5/3-nucleotidase [Synergistaceae bacterium]
MRLLLTNDDGVFATGIAILARKLAEVGHHVVVVAPDRERSSIGHAVTLTRPLRLVRVESGPYPPGLEVYACDGTPSDCVVLGLEEISPDAELILSGINGGPNLGDDVTYSGTVSAAMEGILMKKTSVAVSLDCRIDDEEKRYETAALVVVRMLAWMKVNPVSEGVLLNVNVPNLPFAQLKGIKATRKGQRIYAGKVNKLRDPNGRTYYWIAGKPEDDLVEGTDVWAVSHGYVSVTPLHMDMTHYPSLERFQASGIENALGEEAQ